MLAVGAAGRSGGRWVTGRPAVCIYEVGKAGGGELVVPKSAAGYGQKNHS